MKKSFPPRSTLKNLPLTSSLGAVDIHFHGAFGIDLMSAGPSDLNQLSQELWKEGVAGFCPTTLSVAPEELLHTVIRLGNWIRSGNFAGAVPLGIHLEGPFLSPSACGAHPVGAIRKLDLEELENLWDASHKTLKILTIAPEILDSQKISTLCSWALNRNITLSLGHSRATEKQAKLAFDAGFSSVTHAWNAMPFHHRDPGPLGAALGRKDISVELIIDRVHVCASLMAWTLQLHPHGVCMISDCTPAAGTETGSWHSFGPIRTSVAAGASRTQNGELAGGGFPLPRLFCNWLNEESESLGQITAGLLKKTLPSLTILPLKSIGVSPRRIQHLKLQWLNDKNGRLTFRHAHPRRK